MGDDFELGKVVVVEAVKAKELRNPMPGEIMGALRRATYEQGERNTPTGMAADLNQLKKSIDYYIEETVVHGTDRSFVKPSLEAAVERSLVYEEWHRVMGMEFSPEELELINEARRRLSNPEMMTRFKDAALNFQGQVLRSSELALPQAIIEGEEAHVNAVASIAMDEFMAGRADALTLIATILHDSRKYFPPVEGETQGKMRLWSHELTSAIGARLSSQEYFKLVGFDEKQTEILAKWVEFVVAHHGFAEFPMNLAVAAGEEIETRKTVAYGGRQIPVGVFVMMGTGEAYGVVRNESVLSSLTEEERNQLEMMRAMDNVDGMIDSSFPKYVFGTSNKVLDGCADLGDFLVGSCGRTFTLNARDGGVVNYPELVAAQGENIFRSLVFIAAGSLDPDNLALGEIYEKLGPEVSGKVKKLVKELRDAFGKWKAYEGNKKGDFEARRADFAQSLRQAQSKMVEIYKIDIDGLVDANLGAYEFAEQVLDARAMATGATGNEDKMYSKFDALHLARVAREMVLPAVANRLASGEEGRRRSMIIEDFVQERR